MDDLEILQRLRRMVEYNWHSEVGTYFGAHPVDRIRRWLGTPLPIATREDVCHALDRAIEQLREGKP